MDNLTPAQLIVSESLLLIPPKSREAWLQSNYIGALAEAEKIVASAETATTRYGDKLLRFDELRGSFSKATTDADRWVALTLWAVRNERGALSDRTKSAIKDEVDRGNTEFLIRLGMAAKKKAAVPDRFRLVLLAGWTRRLPPPLKAPAFCFWTDQALADFASAFYGRHTLDQIRKIRSRELNLARAPKPLVNGFIERNGKVGFTLVDLPCR